MIFAQAFKKVRGWERRTPGHTNAICFSTEILVLPSTVLLTHFPSAFPLLDTVFNKRPRLLLQPSNRTENYGTKML